jgi:hypothetical protein
MWNNTDDPSIIQYTQVGNFKVAVNQVLNGLEIFIKGYGTTNEEPGMGGPLYLDLAADNEITDEPSHPILYVWGDINDEDFTQKFSLIGAQEKLYRGGE